MQEARIKDLEVSLNFGDAEMQEATIQVFFSLIGMCGSKFKAAFTICHPAATRMPKCGFPHFPVQKLPFSN